MWKGVFLNFFFKVFFFNTIFTRRFWNFFPPFCIPCVFNWIELNWIELEFNSLGFVLSRKFQKQIVNCKDIYLFFMLLILLKIWKIYCLLHIMSYHYYPLAKIHLCEGYFNTSRHWHMNMCYLIRLHVDMLTLFKKLFNKGIDIIVNAKSENGKFFFTFNMSK